MKIESFIRILAGGVVLIGVALTFFVSRWWLLLPAFAGANLIQSDFTGLCAPSLLFAKLGWLDGDGTIRWGARHRAPSPGEADAAVKSGVAVLVDVREPAEWTGGVAHPAALLPLSDLKGLRLSWSPFLEKHRGKRIYLYCRSGARSAMATTILKAEGIDAVNVGSLSGWIESGLPTREPRDAAA